MRRERPDLSSATVLALLLALAAIGCRNEAPPAEAPAVEFRLPSLEGQLVDAADFAGRVLLVEFWATWCAPCRVQAEILADLHAELGGAEVAFLAVSVGEDAEIVREFLRDSPFPYPVLVDSRDELSARLGIYALPTVMVLDRAGRIAYFETGLSPASKLRRALAEARL